MTNGTRITAFLCALLLLACYLPTVSAQAKTVAEWLEGYETGEVWFGEDFAYDITDTEACWELLMKPITVLDAGEKEAIGAAKDPRRR